jgi:hypothetical protein
LWLNDDANSRQRRAKTAHRTSFRGDRTCSASRRMVITYRIPGGQSYQNVSRETVLSDWTRKPDKTDAPNLTPRRHDEIELIHLDGGILT